MAVAVAVAPALQHTWADHPENASRVPAVSAKLEALGLTADCLPDKIFKLEAQCGASMEQLTAVHNTEYVARLREAVATRAPSVLADEADPDGITYITRTSYEDALMAAGVAIALVDLVVEASRPCTEGAIAVDGAHGGKPPTGLGLIRPPGHHATRVGYAMMDGSTVQGFCLLNNVALAARHAQRAHKLARVCIVDFDVHHGNGTQDIFYDDPSVLFVDIHQDGVWPKSGQRNETGIGAGVNTTINIPLPVGSGDSAARYMFSHILSPAVRRFKPDLILVSAGYDAHWRDPLEKQQFQSRTYHFLTGGLRMLADDLCGGRMVVLLEGGYDLQGLSEGVAESLLALLGDASKHPLEPVPAPEPDEAVHDAIACIATLHGLQSIELNKPATAG